MPSLQGIAFTLAALVSLGVIAFEATRHNAPTITSADLAATTEGVAASLITAGNVPAVGTTWTATGVNGNRITFTVTAAQGTQAITLRAVAVGVTAIGGAHK